MGCAGNLALQHLTHCACSSVVNAVNAASCAMRPMARAPQVARSASGGRIEIRWGGLDTPPRSSAATRPTTGGSFLGGYSNNDRALVPRGACSTDDGAPAWVVDLRGRLGPVAGEGLGQLQAGTGQLHREVGAREAGQCFAEAGAGVTVTGGQADEALRSCRGGHQVVAAVGLGTLGEPSGGGRPLVDVTGGKEHLDQRGEQGCG